jgi:hypothetical protein
MSIGVSRVLNPSILFHARQRSEQSPLTRPGFMLLQERYLAFGARNQFSTSSILLSSLIAPSQNDRNRRARDYAHFGDPYCVKGRSVLLETAKIS